MLDTSITFCQHQLVRNQLHLKWTSSHTHQFMITRERIQKMPSNLGHVKGRRQASSPYYTKAFSMATSTSTKTKALWDNPLQLFFLKAHPFHLCQNEFLLWLYKIFSYYWNNYFLFDLLYIRFSNFERQKHIFLDLQRRDLQINCNGDSFYYQKNLYPIFLWLELQKN